MNARPRPSVDDRFLALTEIPDDGCWQWLGATMSNGYGKFSPTKTRSPMLAHRWAHERFKGPIPAGLVIDHLCRNRSCVNPSHLEAVEQAENARRGARGRLVTVCVKGHPYTPENTLVERDGRRRCRTCKRARNRQYHARRAGRSEVTT